MRILNGLLAFTLTLAITLASSHAGSPPVFSDDRGAIRGYDPVSYFSSDKPVMGLPELSYEWNGTTWHFSSSGNLEMFREDPEAYAPQYGGYCAWAASRGYVAPTDPTAWTVHEGKLYLNYSHRVHRRWSRDIAGNVSKGNMNWPGILDQ